MLLRRGWLLLCAFSLAVIAASVLFFAAPARHSKAAALPLHFDPYLHRTSGAMADPVNLIFRGGTLAEASAAVQQVLGWSPTQGSDMVFLDHGNQVPAGPQFGLSLGGGNRLHMRLEAEKQAGGQFYILAGVHRDQMTACGHVGQAFDTERDLVATAFTDLGYHVTRLQLQNTKPARQCDGSMTGDDGTVAVIDLNEHDAHMLGPVFPVGGPLPQIYVTLPS